MRRNLAIALLALGTIGGYGSGIAHFARAHHTHCTAACPPDGPDRRPDGR